MKPITNARARSAAFDILPAPGTRPKTIASMNRSAQLSAPRYWPARLGMALLWCLSRLPYRWAVFVGRRLGDLTLLFASYRRNIVRANLKLCFPDLSEAQRRHLERENFRYTGQGLAEAALAWWGDSKRLRRLAHVEGLEHLQRLQEEGRGTLLIGAHMTSMELVGRLLTIEIPFSVVYREHKNPVMERFMQKGRRFYETAISRRETLTLLRRLKSGRIVWYPPDQDFGRQHSVFAPLFGIPAATITVPARLAAKPGAAVVPISYWAREDGSGYELHLHPPLEDFPSGDDEADAARLNALFEEDIRRHPAQYYWVHRRFKTRPPGEPRFYPKRRRNKKGR